ncbi:ABC-2 transporter permease [Enterocloster citroniae]|uniref:ABC-2 transporter permease n=1 Tax=Enterocloster citroniae TaxID=358743 RepID=UPI00349E55BE
MMGLLIKDLYCLKQNGKSLMFILLIWGLVFLPRDDGGLILISLCMMVSAMHIFTLASYDKQARWDTYALSMPLTRANMVQEKYIMSLLLLVMSAVVSTFVVATAWLIRTGGMEPDFIPSIAATLAVGAGISLFYTALSLPLSMWLGVEKARYIPSVLFALIFFTAVIMVRGGSHIGLRADHLIAFGLGALILSVALFIISYFICLFIYGKKEF